MASLVSSYRPTANGTDAPYQPNVSNSNTPKQSGNFPTLKLNDGNEIPVFAFGVGSALTNGEHILNATSAAIRNGFYHLDGAEVDGNEKALGDAIKRSGLPRSQFFVTTKLWTVATTVKASLDASLERLGLDYVDLYLVHWPQVAKTPDQLQQIWAEMEAVKQSGKARSIGVSNFVQEHLETILRTAKVKPAINHVEFHPYLQHGNLLDFHRQQGIATGAYGTLAPLRKGAPGPVDSIFTSLARKYQVTESEIAIRWAMDQGIAVATTSTSEERIQGYSRRIPSFKLSPDEIQEISQLGRQKHFRGYFTDIYRDEDRR
ncbi:Aldo/keto reductase [Hypoxylon fragiforme]|uniref:Aldo/keto reductase n=1 Tax=Hypoxylon fragiforme TaxID=63214 RepID=UPI0020C65129|nr:Aldo/keto reductase [Hypoxylon fragiforme]KAI2611432.1 Aldo/keto reductase [Hypoxylon fragiforme]